MSSAWLQNTRLIYKNQFYFYRVAMKKLKMKFKKQFNLQEPITWSYTLHCSKAPCSREAKKDLPSNKKERKLYAEDNKAMPSITRKKYYVQLDRSVICAGRGSARAPEICRPEGQCKFNLPLCLRCPQSYGWLFISL